MYGISHQKAGLNRPGKYKECSRERRLLDAWRFLLQHKDTKAQRHEEGKEVKRAVWKRLTGILPAVEGKMSAKERREGLKRLVERIKEFTTERTENTEKRQGLGCRVSGIGNSDDTELSLMAPFAREVETWAGAAERSIESLCVELQVSRARLTMLTKEYCGLSVGELVDGFKVRRLKNALVVRLREAAQELWGLPGVWASFKYQGFTFSTQRHEDTKARGADGYRASGFGSRDGTHGQPTANRGCPWHTGKRSRYFRMRAEDYASEERGDERARRIGELVAEMRRGFDMEDWAARVGFASGARLKRACLNVLGRSLRAIERALAEEVVRYYLCAEDKVLREVARREDETANVIRARWIYGKSELAPTEPFLDEWSKAEELAKDWLEKMKAGFG